MPELTASFQHNVVDARDNGFDLVCVQCGMGMNDDDFEDPEAHEGDCPNRGRDRTAEMVAFLERRLDREGGDGGSEADAARDGVARRGVRRSCAS